MQTFQLFCAICNQQTAATIAADHSLEWVCTCTVCSHIVKFQGGHAPLIPQIQAHNRENFPRVLADEAGNPILTEQMSADLASLYADPGQVE